MYKDNGIDPEGLLSTIPAIAHVLIGFYVGRLMLGDKDSAGRSREEILQSHRGRKYREENLNFHEGGRANSDVRE